ncbi:MAG: lipopolysaccharide transport system ATP-binding protein [Anaerolineaceae bacterium]|nr:MAG: lipopolysaccharide transport system ATP-binding protein [Anaerolineaceae bacterium]
MKPVIRVENLGKRYRIGMAPLKYETLSGKITDALSAPLRALRRVQSPKADGADTIWALRGVSFDVKQGQVLGIIGRNGAGKSTLLKVLSHITEPTEGSVTIRGRVGSLLEVGTGFHPELTGRENIFLNGAILGMKRAEIERKFDEIVDFSEVEQFIDTPVKRYSSGMYLRLAFAVAAHLEPEILVVDEVLAVGDAEFQKKCLGKIGDVAQQGRTVLFVSHNMSAVLRLTQESIVLEKGRLTLRAPSPEAVDRYLSAGHSQAGERFWEADEVPADAAPFRPLSLRLCDGRGRTVDSVRSTEPVIIEMEYALSAPVTGLRIGLYLNTARGEAVFTTFDTDEPHMFEKHTSRAAGQYVSRCTIPADTLNAGRYGLGVNASSYHIKRYFQDDQALDFSVDAAGAPGMHWVETRPGVVRPRLEWSIEAKRK